MRFTDSLWFSRAMLLGIAVLLASCASPQRTPEPTALPKPDWIAFPPVEYPPTPVQAPAGLPAKPQVQQAAPTAFAKDWQTYRLRAAKRIADMNPASTYSGPVPDPLASIPVLQIQLNADGSVRNIEVLRTPKFEPQTVEMAKIAVARAAPFGPVGHLPRPWQFSETFLYNDALKFKLRSLEAGE